jgi:hypothetical protein
VALRGGSAGGASASGWRSTPEMIARPRGSLSARSTVRRAL